MQVKQLYVNGVSGLENVSVFFHKNTIIMGQNNSGKTRILFILETIFKNSKEGFQKLFNSCTNEAKIKVEFTNLDKNYYWVFEGKQLKQSKNNDNLTIDVCFIPSSNLDLNTWVTNFMQNEISKSQEFYVLKKRVQDLTNKYLVNINKGIFLDKERNNIKSKLQDKLPTFQIQLLRDGLIINEESDGFKKYIMIELLMENLLNSDNKLILIDEIENHFSVETINFILNKIPPKTQIIATSHRIEINNSKLNTITTINNEVLDKIGVYVSDHMSNKTIVVEGKNDVPIISRVLQILDEENKWIVVVGTSKSQAMQISKKYNCIAFVDKDDKNINFNSESKSRNRKIYFTKRRQIENYVPQIFIDNDKALKGIQMTKTKTIENMVQESSYFKSNSAFKNYISSTVLSWLKGDNTLVKEIQNILKQN